MNRNNLANGLEKSFSKKTKTSILFLKYYLELLTPPDQWQRLRLMVGVKHLILPDHHHGSEGHQSGWGDGLCDEAFQRLTTTEICNTILLWFLGATIIQTDSHPNINGVLRRMNVSCTNPKIFSVRLDVVCVGASRSASLQRSKWRCLLPSIDKNSPLTHSLLG